MRPLFSYFGSKYKLAKHYGAPKRDTVIEPFAGSAAYSLFWEPKNVILVEKNPVIAGIWKYLVAADASGISALPTDFHHVDEIDVSPVEKDLIGFWIGKGKVSPGRSKSKWGIEYASHTDCKVWNEAVKARIIAALPKIAHWEIIEGDYTSAPDIDAHWFVDPPYITAGKRYPTRDVDYNDLAVWAKSRQGFVQVCENEGANYLPFEPFRSVNTYHHIKEDGVRAAKYSLESLYQQETFQ